MARTVPHPAAHRYEAPPARAPRRAEPAGRRGGSACSFVPHYDVRDYTRRQLEVCGHIVMAYLVMAYLVMAYVMMAYEVMTYDVCECTRRQLEVLPQ